MFAKAMAGYMGTRTKYFPWLVEQALIDSNIPERDHSRIGTGGATNSYQQRETREEESCWSKNRSATKDGAANSPWARAC